MKTIEEDKPIDVTSDYIFKGIFSDESRTKDFLFNVLVGKDKFFPKDTIIEELQYLKNEHIQNKLQEDAKKTIFDLQIKTSYGLFIIEMQKNASADYLKRVEFYNATAYSQQQIKEGQSSMKDYTQALPVVTISVIKEKIFDDAVPCVSYHLNVERKTQTQYMKAFSYVFIELEKFGNERYDQSSISKDEEEWLLFMKEQNLNHKYHNEQVNRAVEYVQYIKRDKYTEYVRQQMSEVAAQKEIESAEARGGHNKALEFARAMLAEGESIQKIAKMTKLSVSDVEKLKL